MLRYTNGLTCNSNLAFGYRIVWMKASILTCLVIIRWDASAFVGIITRLRDKGNLSDNYKERSSLGF